MNMAPDLDFLLRALLPRAEEGGVEDGGHLLRRDLRCEPWVANKDFGELELRTSKFQI